MKVSPTTIEGLVRDAGFRVRREGRRTWRLRVETGVLHLFLEVRLGTTLVWVGTRGYLPVPPSRRDEVARAVLPLQGETGLARFVGLTHSSGRLRMVEVIAALPQEGLTPALVRRAVEGVIEAAVWHGARLQAVVLGEEPPPPWPEGEDPAIGIRWTDGEV